MKKIKINLPVDDVKIILRLFMSNNFYMFDSPQVNGAKKSILHDVAKKMLNYQVNSKTIRLLKYHEAWAILEALKQVKLHDNAHYEINLVQRLIAQLDQQLN